MGSRTTRTEGLCPTCVIVSTTAERVSTTRGHCTTSIRLWQSIQRSHARQPPRASHYRQIQRQSTVIIIITTGTVMTWREELQVYVWILVCVRRDVYATEELALFKIHGRMQHTQHAHV